MFYNRQKRFFNPIPSTRRRFLNPNRKDKFSNSIPSFDESFDVESTLLCINKIDGWFNVEYILMEDQVEFVTYKQKGRATAWWNRFQNIRIYQGKPALKM